MELKNSSLVALNHIECAVDQYLLESVRASRPLFVRTGIAHSILLKTSIHVSRYLAPPLHVARLDTSAMISVIVRLQHVVQHVDVTYSILVGEIAIHFV